jgi:hypothetical protein
MQSFGKRRRAGVEKILGGNKVGRRCIVARIRFQEATDGVVTGEKSILGT